MDLNNSLLIVVSVIASAWGIYQTFVTHKLSLEIQKLNARSDLTVQRLYRAREALKAFHRAQVDFAYYVYVTDWTSDNAEFTVVYSPTAHNGRWHATRFKVVLEEWKVPAYAVVKEHELTAEEIAHFEKLTAVIGGLGP